MPAVRATGDHLEAELAGPLHDSLQHLELEQPSAVLFHIALFVCAYKMECAARSRAKHTNLNGVLPPGCPARFSRREKNLLVEHGRRGLARQRGLCEPTGQMCRDTSQFESCQACGGVA